MENSDFIFPNIGIGSPVVPVADSVYGMLSSKIGFRTNRKASISPPLLIPDNGHDSDSSLKSNSVDGSVRIYRRPQSSMDKLGSLCDPSLPLTCSSLPSDTDNDDTLLLGITDSSSTKDLTNACTMKDTPQERDTCDVSEVVTGCSEE